MARVLVPLPDRDYDVTEASVPWRMLTGQGHEVIFATEKGSVAQADPLLLTGVLFGKLGADPEPRQFYAQMLDSREYRHPIEWAAIEPAMYDALVLPGGHAPGMRQYLGSALLQAKVAAFWKLQRPVGAICHGVLVLARSRDPETGRSVLHASRTTSLTKAQERTAYYLSFWKLGRYYRTYPAYVEDEVKAALDSKSQYLRGPLALTARGSMSDDSAAFVVEDGRYVSARWPGDAYLFARKLLDRLTPATAPR